MVLAWYMLKITFPNDPKLRVMGLFGCTHKTVAVGVPLINAIYEGNPAVGLYTLPLLIWHPMQLVIGTFLTPRLVKFVKQEQERLGIATTTEHPSSDQAADGVVPAESDAAHVSGDATEKGSVSQKTPGTNEDDQVASLHVAEEGRD
jgi:hypothetical protein